MPIPPDHVFPLEQRIIRWTRRRIMRCIRATDPEKASDALEEIWDRVTRSARFADSAFAAIQQLRDLGVLYDDEGACLLNEIYEYRSEYYEHHDIEYTALMAEHAHKVLDLASEEDAPEWARLRRRARELKAAYLRARGELTLAARVLADEPDLAAYFSHGESSLVLDKQPMPEIEPPDGEWVALLRERITALITAEDGRSTFELLDRLHDAASEAAPASVVEAARQLLEIGVASRDQAYSIIDDAVERLLSEVIRSDRVGSKLLDEHEGWLPASRPAEEIEAALARRSNQLRVYLLRRLGQHEMAELLRHDQKTYDDIVDRIALSDWLEAQVRDKREEEADESS